MERQQRQQQSNKSKDKIFRFIPKPASLMNFRNDPLSPSRDHHKLFKTHNYHTSKGFFGPMVCIIPDEVRRKPKKQGSDQPLEDQEREPTSPRVSCIGQINYKKQKENGNKNRNVIIPQFLSSTLQEKRTSDANTTTTTISNKLFGTKTRKKPWNSNAWNCGSSSKEGGKTEAVVVPRLSQVKKFSGCPDAFVNFDWTEQFDHAIQFDHPDYYSDEEGGCSTVEEEEEEEVMFRFSARVISTSGGELKLKQREEINIWNRRTKKTPPSPLQLS